jgi:hypothetical protein
MGLDKQIKLMIKKGELTPVEINTEEIFDEIEQDMEDYRMQVASNRYLAEKELNQTYLTNGFAGKVHSH